MVVIRAYGDLGAIQDLPWAGFERARTIADAMFIYPVVLALVGIPLVFPDGRLPSSRFRSIVVLAFPSVCSAWLLGSAFGVHLDVVVLFSVPIAFVGAMLAVSLRFRRGDRVQRQQVKWLAAVVIVGTAAVLAALLLSPDFADLGNALFIVGFVALFALPFVIGLSILRYRLYEIDRILSRTIGYVLMTGVLLAAYTAAIPAAAGPAGHDHRRQHDLGSALDPRRGCPLQPLRRRVQVTVDRRFDRARIDAERTSAEFSERLREQVDIAAVIDDLDRTVRGALKPTTIGLWLRRSAE